MVRHITYTDANMSISAEICSLSALKYDCGTSTIYTHKDLSEAFKTQNKGMLSQPKGAGYFIWKSQIILQEFNRAKYGDVILYTDAGIEIINSVKPLIAAMDSPVMVFGGLWEQRHWCKGDALIQGEYKQLNAAAMLFKVEFEALEFIKEWNELCQVPGLIDDTPSKIPNHPEFQEHRWDQALLTTVQIERNIEPFWMPSRVNGSINPHKYRGNYPVTFNHHRKRNAEWKSQ